MKFLTTDEYANLMGIHPNTAQTLCREGKVSAVKIGGQWRIPEPTDEAPEEPAPPEPDREPQARALAQMVYDSIMANLPVSVSFGGQP